MDSKAIVDFLNKENITCDIDKANKLMRLMDFTLQENEHVNLTAIKDKEEFIEKMILDSAVVFKNVDLNSVSSILDVGSGAGFPGLVIAILYPNLKITCLDSTKKKCSHIQNACLKLGILNVTVVHQRAEEYIKQNVEKFDIVVSRAVASLNILLELCTSFVKVNGYVIAMKSLKYEKELNDAKKAIKKLGLNLEKIETTFLPLTNSTRFNIIFKKIHKTPNKFPRSYNEISSKPL